MFYRMGGEHWSTGLERAGLQAGWRELVYRMERACLQDWIGMVFKIG